MSDGFDEHVGVKIQTERPFAAKGDLLAELYRQKCESLHNQNRSTSPDKNHNLNLKFDEAKEKIKQEIISSDKSLDNSIIYTAMANFKKRKV